VCEALRRLSRRPDRLEERVSSPMFGPRVIRHPNGPLRPPLAMQLRRHMRRSRRTAAAALSVYGLVSLGLLGLLARLSLG
jgi:hypothetical protein